MSNLRSSLNDLAASFASAILEAVRGASLEELVGKDRGGPRRAGVPSKRKVAPSAPGGASKSNGQTSGRLPRRSADDIATSLQAVVALLKKNRGGLRAEQIRKQLGMQIKEMPRILKGGLSNKSLKSKGQKRATTYWAA